MTFRFLQEFLSLCKNHKMFHVQNDVAVFFSVMLVFLFLTFYFFKWLFKNCVFVLYFQNLIIFNKLHIFSETCSYFRSSQVLGQVSALWFLQAQVSWHRWCFLQWGDSLTPEEAAGLKTTGECWQETDAHWMQHKAWDCVFVVVTRGFWS